MGGYPGLKPQLSENTDGGSGISLVCRPIPGEPQAQGKGLVPGGQFLNFALNLPDHQPEGFRVIGRHPAPFPGLPVRPCQLQGKAKGGYLSSAVRRVHSFISQRIISASDVVSPIAGLFPIQ